MKNKRTLFFYFLALGILAVVAGLLFGATGGWDSEIIWGLRLPRVLLGLGVGAGLALAGLVLQASFANPLCEPYTLGISSGAAVGAVLAMSFKSSSLAMALGTGGAALAGSMVFAFVLLGFSYRTVSPSSLLLVGVMLQYFGASVVALWTALSDPAGVQGALFWLLGDLSRASLESSLLMIGLVILLLTYLLTQARDLDAVLLGDLEARGLGVNPSAVRRKMIFFSSLLVSFCVSSSGMIGFIGFLVPHFCRRVVGTSHRVLIGFTALGGAIVLVLSDLMARVLLSPFEVPVGVITGLVGAPAFVALYFKRTHR